MQLAGGITPRTARIFHRQRRERVAAHFIYKSAIARKILRPIGTITNRDDKPIVEDKEEGV